VRHSAYSVQNTGTMKSKTTISTANKFKGNPRKISDKQKRLLSEHLTELGDLSGVIYCHNAKAYVGGNQRADVFDGAEIEITERFDTPTIHHTIAHGFIKWQGEKYVYREVAFTPEQFRKACIVANNDGGEFDFDILKMDWNIGELADWGLDLPVFGDNEESGVSNELADKTPPDDFAEYDENIDTEHECPKCGYKWSGGK